MGPANELKGSLFWAIWALMGFEQIPTKPIITPLSWSRCHKQISQYYNCSTRNMKTLIGCCMSHDKLKQPIRVHYFRAQSDCTLNLFMKVDFRPSFLHCISVGRNVAFQMFETEQHTTIPTTNKCGT